MHQGKAHVAARRDRERSGSSRKQIEAENVWNHSRCADWNGEVTCPVLAINVPLDKQVLPEQAAGNPQGPRTGRQQARRD